jgi:hypothetical protein
VEVVFFRMPVASPDKAVPLILVTVGDGSVPLRSPPAVEEIPAAVPRAKLVMAVAPVPVRAVMSARAALLSAPVVVVFLTIPVPKVAQF